MEYRASIEALSASTINVRLSAIRKLVGEARRLGLVGFEEAANLTDVPNLRQKGTRLRNERTVPTACQQPVVRNGLSRPLRLSGTRATHHGQEI